VLAELIDTRRSALVGYASVLTGDVSQAEDLVHEALLRTFRARGTFDSAAHAEGYVRKAIASTFLNARRSHLRFLAKRHLLAAPDAPPDLDARMDAHADVREALALLSPRERACVVLRHMEGLSTRETAHALGLAEGTVKRYLANGMGALQRALGPQAQPAGGPEHGAVPVFPHRRSS